MARLARFERHARITRPGDFERIFQSGRRIADKVLTAVVAVSAGERARLGLAVPKKAAPDAVDRNRIKRHVRESFRAHRATLPPADIVILARAGSARASAVELRANLERLWRRIVERHACAPA